MDNTEIDHSVCGECGVSAFHYGELRRNLKDKEDVIEEMRLIIEEMRNQPTAGHRRETLTFISGQCGYGWPYSERPLIP
jgi:hypothetical protein